jgi:hypothetical protein
MIENTLSELQDLAERLETGEDVQMTTVMRLPFELVYASIKMRDDTLSEPKWYIRNNGALHDLSRALTGPGFPECEAQIKHAGQVFVRG